MNDLLKLGPVLITGISGFIAGNLARSLMADGVEVVGVGRSRAVRVECRFEELDVRDFSAVRELVGRVRPGVVFHLAAFSVLSAVVTDGPQAMLETNVGGTTNVLEASREVGVGAVVVSSSDKQYGALAVPPYRDDDATGFINGGVYELSKAQQDQVARMYAGLYETPSVRVARLVNVYGPGDRQWTRIVPGNIRRTFLGERPRVTAGAAGAALREYLYVDDCVRALRELAEHALREGNAPFRREDGKLARVAVNLASGHRYAAAEVIGAIQRIMREEHGVDGPEPEVLPGPEGVFEPGSQYTAGEKIRGLVEGWAPRDLEVGLRATIPWYLGELRG